MYREIDRETTKGYILSAIEQGATLASAARGVGIARLTLYRWLEADGCFHLDYYMAWEAAKKKREYLSWYKHPFRGLRPPTGKGTRSRPRFSR